MDFGVVHAHDISTLPAGWWLARRRGSRLVYDAHELYSGFEANPPRFWARASLLLERALARRANAVVTVNPPIAGELVRRLSLVRTPIVVFNCPPLEDVSVDPRDGQPVRAIYQAAVGPNRHLEDVVSAARESEVEITVRVVGNVAASLPGVVVEQAVSPHELVAALAPYDIGLVIDRPETDNTRLALPNKLFEYLMAGLAVVVPRAPAMAEFVEAQRRGHRLRAGGDGCCA